MLHLFDHHLHFHFECFQFYEYFQVVERMRKDLRRKMEKEILEIQTQLFRDEDDSYFRQLDADRLLQELQMARYQARI